MNFDLPLKSHRWIHRGKWNRCNCGCETYFDFATKRWCLEKLKLFFDEKGYVLKKKGE